MSSIRIIPLHPAPIELLPSIVPPLESIFQTEIEIERPVTNLLEHAFDDSRGQYNSTDIIRLLLDRPVKKERKLLERFFSPESDIVPPRNESGKIVGITAVDLFVPILTYVFGEAQLDGLACVVSSYRLDNAIYGLPPDPILFYERVLKETVHELGHTYGLYHCRNLECAMHTSTAVEDIDVKGAILCNDCRRKMHK